MLVDSHAHINSTAFDEDREQVIVRAFEQGIRLILDVGTNPEEWQKSIKLASDQAMIFSAIGLHPNDADLWNEEVQSKLERLLSSDKVVAIGETGLDYYRMGSSVKKQKKLFSTHLQLAKKFSKPVIIHCRDAWEDVLDVLASEGKDTVGILHSFSGNLDHARLGLQLGYYISFSGSVTYKSSSGLRETAGYVPLDRLLVETDSPYLPPQPYRGKRNEPSYIRKTLEVIAECRNAQLEELEAAITSNAVKLLGITGLPN